MGCAAWIRIGCKAQVTCVSRDRARGDSIVVVRAAERGRKKVVVDLLLSKKAEVHEKDRNGKTALMYAVEKGHTPIARFLLGVGAKVNERDNNNQTALMYAAGGGQNEAVTFLIEKVAKKVGTPKQIVADYGSDIKKGVHLYQKKQPTVIYTYDVTHKMAGLLKKELQKDEKWLSFLKQCGKACTGLKQTNLYFLAPPRQRTKARYSNVAPQIQWAQKMIAYQQQGDYSQIDPTYTLDQQTIEAVQDEFGHATALLFTAMPSKTYANRDAFTRSLVAYIGVTQIERIQAVVYPAADRGRRRFNEKLGWVTEYQEELALYAQMVDLIDLVQTQVKQDGLNQASHQRFEEHTAAISLLPRAQSLAEQISGYLRFEGQQIPDQQTLLGTSDAIESVIGKYKYLSVESPMRDVGKMILTIPVFTTKLTCELVKTAMESVQALDVDKWADNLLGKSTLSGMVHFRTRSSLQIMYIQKIYT